MTLLQNGRSLDFSMIGLLTLYHPTLCLHFSLFFKQEMELSLVGLQNAGKTSLLNAIAVSETQTLHILSSMYSCYPFTLIILCFHYQTGGYSEDMIPTVSIFSRTNCGIRFITFFWVVWKIYVSSTLRGILSYYENQVGFNMRKVTKGNVTIKVWDLGGQRRFRTMWERYCRGVSVIV